MRKFCTFVLIFCLLFSLAACGSGSDPLHARYNALYLRDFPQEYLNADADNEEVMGFGLENFAETFADPAAFHCYNAEISVANDNDFPINILSLTMDSAENGKHGVWFSTYDGGVTVGLPAHFDGNQTLYYTVIAEKDLSMDDIFKALDKMNVRCVYVNADTGIEAMSEVTEKDTLSESPITHSK